MPYYHISINYIDPYTNFPCHLTSFDRISLSIVKEKVIYPYMQEEEFIFHGTKMSGKDVISLKVYQSDYPIKECLQILNSEYIDSYSTLSENEILGKYDCVPDVTDRVFDTIDSETKAPSAKTEIQILPSTQMRERKLFISHSSENQKEADALVNLLEFLGFDKSNLLCSSVGGFRIELNENIFEYIKSQYDRPDLYVIFLLSPEYYRSAICLNEMGATWITNKQHTSILLPSLQFEDLQGVVSKERIAIKLDADDAKERLNELRSHLQEFFALPPKDQNRWEHKRDAFIETILKSQQS